MLLTEGTWNDCSSESSESDELPYDELKPFLDFLTLRYNFPSSSKSSEELELSLLDDV
jgi:hypothetical protein